MARVELTYMFDKEETSSVDMERFVDESEEFVRTLTPAGADMRVRRELAEYDEDAYHFLDISGIVYGAQTYREVGERLGALQHTLHERFDLYQRTLMEKAVAAVAISGAADNMRVSPMSTEK